MEEEHRQQAVVEFVVGSGGSVRESQRAASKKVAQARIVAVEVLKLGRRSAAKELQVVKDNPDEKTRGIRKEERCSLVINTTRAVLRTWRDSGKDKVDCLHFWKTFKHRHCKFSKRARQMSHGLEHSIAIYNNCTVEWQIMW